MAARQKELDRKVGAVEDRLKRLDAQIALAQSATEQVIKVGSLLRGRKKKE